MDPAIKKHPASAYFKLIVLSIIGIFVFFIDFPFPAYNVLGYTVPEASTILVNHLTSLLRALLWNGSFKVMPYVVLAIAAYGLVDLGIRRKKFFSNALNTTFSIMRILGVVFLVFMVFKIGPAFMHESREALNGSSIAAFVLNGVLITICISIPLSAVFLPLLLDYGLMEYIGVLLRPVMRPIFKLPGRSAVLLITANLGNFSVAHLALNDQYENGNMTEREAIVIATSFATSSIAFMMVLAKNARIMEDYWNAYFWSVFLITILISLIGARLFPLSRIKDEYAPGAVPNPEKRYKGKLLRSALNEGLDVAVAAKNPVKGVGHILKGTVAILASIVMGAGFSSSVGMLLYFYTPVFEWIGYIFRPLMWLVQMPASEVVAASTGAAISLLEVTIPSLIVSAGNWSLHIRYMMAAVPISSVIFLGSFVPSILGTNLPVKFWHMMIIWLERMILSVLFSGLFALLLFGIPV